MEVAQRSSKRKTMARTVFPNPSGSPVVNTRSRARKQALGEQPATSTKSEEILSLGSSSRKKQMPKPSFESTRIESAQPVGQSRASPGKRGYEDDIPIKEENKKDFSVQVSLCRNCDPRSVSLFAFLKPFLMVFVLMMATLYCKDIVSMDLLKEYASNMKTPSITFAKLKMDDYLDIFSGTWRAEYSET